MNANKPTPVKTVFQSYNGYQVYKVATVQHWCSAAEMARRLEEKMTA